MVKFAHFLLDVLNVLHAVSAVFQRVEATIGDVLTEVESACERLEELKERLVKVMVIIYGVGVVIVVLAYGGRLF